MHIALGGYKQDLYIKEYTPQKLSWLILEVSDSPILDFTQEGDQFAL